MTNETQSLQLDPEMSNPELITGIPESVASTSQEAQDEVLQQQIIDSVPGVTTTPEVGKPDSRKEEVSKFAAAKLIAKAQSSINTSLEADQHTAEMTEAYNRQFEDKS